MKIVVAPEALADFERLREFLVEKDPRAAARAVETLTQAIDSLARFPERGRLAALPKHRELVVPFGRSAYIVRYAFRPEESAVLVTRLWHGREQRT